MPLSSLSHRKMMPTSQMKLKEWRHRWNPNPLHPRNPPRWSLSLGKPTEQERREKHRNLEQKRQQTRAKGTGQGDLQDNPLAWWRENEKEYPLLARIAKRYLCVPGTSIASERVFSTTGDIVTAKRSCLSSEHVNELLFLIKNLVIPKY